MGLYYFITDYDLKSGLYTTVKDKDVQELFNEAKSYDSTLLIRDMSYTEKRLFRKDRLIKKFDIYHYYNGYQAKWQISGSGTKGVVMAYLYGIINGALSVKNLK